MDHRVIAVFASEAEALRARAALMTAGMDESAVAMSADLTSDAIAAEAPGQAYENQGTERGGGLLRSIKTAFTSGADTDTAEARLIADVQRGSVVLTVGPLSEDEVERVTAILKRYRPVAIRKH
jgi:hypothetical protein